MSIAEKLVTVSENASRAVELNRDLETILAGGNTGGKSEMDEFWDAYQQNGTRVNYECGFRGFGWTKETFKPKYDMKPTNATSMFRNCTASIDLVELLSALDIVLDFSNCTSLQETFMSCYFTHLGIIDARSTTTLTNLFCSCRATTIDKLILKNDGSNTFLQTFRTNTHLENITIEGVIGNDIDFSACTNLTPESLMSIINHLQDKTGASTKPVLTIGTTNYNKLTAEEIKIATDKNWEVV